MIGKGKLNTVAATEQDVLEFAAATQAIMLATITDERKLAITNNYKVINDIMSTAVDAEEGRLNVIRFLVSSEKINESISNMHELLTPLLGDRGPDAAMTRVMNSYKLDRNSTKLDMIEENLTAESVSKERLDNDLVFIKDNAAAYTAAVSALIIGVTGDLDIQIKNLLKIQCETTSNDEVDVDKLDQLLDISIQLQGLITAYAKEAFPDETVEDVFTFIKSVLIPQQTESI